MNSRQRLLGRSPPFLSRRTVEQHVANVLRKLKVRSRSELRTG